MLKAARKRERLDIALASLWLARGAPIADVLTMLEVRHRFELSSADCRAYATEVLWAAQQQIHTTKPNLKPHRTEPHHATA